MRVYRPLLVVVLVLFIVLVLLVVILIFRVFFHSKSPHLPDSGQNHCHEPWPQCPHRELSNGTIQYFAYVLDAKLLTPCGTPDTLLVMMRAGGLDTDIS